MRSEIEGAGEISRILSQFKVDICLPDETMREHVNSAKARGLPVVGMFNPHDRVMSIAAGGPSLQDTWRELEGVIVSMNGSLGFLLDKGIKPWACGVIDPREHMADIVAAESGVFYFVASVCHPKLFDKLLRAGCKVILWHPSGCQAVTSEDGDMIAGGTTMGLRWLTLGYYMGFRKFHAHGLDSSFRGDSTHAYPDYRDGVEGLELHGYRTTMNFIEQVEQWFKTKEMFSRLPEADQPSIKLFGDGLLQYRDAQCNLRQ